MSTGSFLKAFSMVIIALLAWFGLILQWYLIAEATKENHLALSAEFIRYISYYTILTNLLVAVCLTSILLAGKSRWGQFCARSEVQTGIALSIGVVGITYSVALRHIWNPTGLQLIVDRTLHDVVPILFVLYWVFFVPKDPLKWKHVFYWLIYPAVYLVYVLIRGSMIDKYPYPFVDKTILNWPTMIRNIAVLFLLFAVMGFLMVGIKKLFKGK